MRQLTTYAALLAMASPFAQADNFKLEYGSNDWSYNISGSARSQDGYNNDNPGGYYFSFEHPVPILPNIRVSRTDRNSSANEQLTKSFAHGSAASGLDEGAGNEVKLDQTDVTMYYQLSDSVVDIDLGVNAKYIDSRSHNNGIASGTDTADVSGWVPMLYAGFDTATPLTGLSISADGSYVAYQDSRFYDYTLKASYITPWYLGVDVGYRSIRLDLNDFDGSRSGVEFDGPFAGARLDF